MEILNIAGSLIIVISPYIVAFGGVSWAARYLSIDSTLIKRAIVAIGYLILASSFFFLSFDLSTDGGITGGSWFNVPFLSIFLMCLWLTCGAATHKTFIWIKNGS